MTKAREAIIFDGDDTLWKTQILYDRVIEQFCDAMMALDYNRHEVKEALNRIDIANINTYHFSEDRFPASLKETYTHFCNLSKSTVDQDLSTKFMEMGYSVFRSIPEAMEGSSELLEKLQMQFELFLYTGGSSDSTMRKLEALKMTTCFKEVYTSRNKNKDELLKIIREQGLHISETWMVGNSPRSDIFPAQSVGLRCILLKGGVWAYDNMQLESRGLWIVSSLKEIEPIVFASINDADAQQG